MSVFAKLISVNVIHLIGLFVYGLILIGLTALGYKVIASVVGFKAAEASEKQSLFMGIITLGLIVGFSLIIAITSYESSPEVVLVPGANIVSPGSRGGGCGSKKRGVPCGQAAIPPPAPQAAPEAESPVTPPEEAPSQ